MEKILKLMVSAVLCVLPFVTCAASMPSFSESQMQSSVAPAAKKTESVVFATKLHCANCARKVQENISFLKGVKDLQVSLEKQEIAVTFDPSKTSSDTIAAEIRKLGYPADIKK